MIYLCLLHKAFVFMAKFECSLPSIMNLAHELQLVGCQLDN